MMLFTILQLSRALPVEPEGFAPTRFTGNASLGLAGLGGSTGSANTGPCDCALPDSDDAQAFRSQELFECLLKSCCGKLPSESESEIDSDDSSSASDSDEESEESLSKRPGGSWANIHLRNAKPAKSKAAKLKDSCRCEDQTSKSAEKKKQSKSEAMREKAFGKPEQNNMSVELYRLGSLNLTT